MEKWMNVEYEYKGTTSIHPFIIAQKEIKTSFSALLQITGQQGSNLPKLQWRHNMWSPLVHLYSWGDEPWLINAKSLWICVLHIDDVIK